MTKTTPRSIPQVGLLEHEPTKVGGGLPAATLVTRPPSPPPKQGDGKKWSVTATPDVSDEIRKVYADHVAETNKKIPFHIGYVVACPQSAVPWVADTYARNGKPHAARLIIKFDDAASPVRLAGVPYPMSRPWPTREAEGFAEGRRGAGAWNLSRYEGIGLQFRNVGPTARR